MRTLHRRRTAVALASSLLLGVLTSLAVVAVPVSAQEASPSPSPSPSPAPEPVQVTQADNGRTVHLVPGQEVVVELTPPSQGEHWQGPATVGPLYLVEYSESASRTRARLQALQSSAEPVVLRAKTDRACFHDGSPCPQGFSEWSLSVVVDEGPAVNPSYECIAMPQVTPAPGTTHLENGSNGSRVTVEQGSTVQVWLRGCEDPYTVAAADGPLHRTSATFRANGVSMTSFRAVGTGSTTIQAHTDPSCFHTATPCARPSRSWSVEVEVVPATDESCAVPTTVELDRATVVATGAAGVTVRTAPGSVVDLYAYTRPSTTYRVVRSGTSDTQGLLRFTVRPPANTRLYAQQRGCQQGPSAVLNVATALSLTAERTGPREYVFAGDSLPARSGGLIVSLYRVTPEGRQVLTAQARADAGNGEWRLVRRFTGSGRFGFVVRTGQDLQNAPGTSNVRSLLVY